MIRVNGQVAVLLNKPSGCSGRGEWTLHITPAVLNARSSPSKSGREILHVLSGRPSTRRDRDEPYRKPSAVSMSINFAQPGAL